MPGEGTQVKGGLQQGARKIVDASERNESSSKKKEN